MPMHISSKDNPIIKNTHALLTQARSRKKLGQTVIEGVHLLDAYLNAHQMPKSVLVSEKGLDNAEIAQLLKRLNGGQILTISDHLYKKISNLGESLPIMAIIDIPNHTLTHAIDTDCLIINDIQDNGNLGTLLRTASAVGFDKVICTKGSASVYSPKSLRAGMGAQFSLVIYENMDTDDILKYIKTPMYATSSHSKQMIYQLDLTKPIALIMGHEGQGISQQLLAHSQAIALPQPNGQESLNVGVAGSICLYEILRQRLFE